MSLFYKPTDKEILNTRNKVLLECATTELYNNGFIKSAFSTAWFGRNNLGDFTYEFVRLQEDSKLELLVVHINKGDSYVKLNLNIFDVGSAITSFKDIENKNALKLHVPPLSLTKMRLRSDDYRFIPIITPFFYKEHKLGFYLSRKGFNNQVNKLCKLLREDCRNIDRFVHRWHEKNTLQSICLE